MSKKNDEKQYITEHVFELRYAAMGEFIDKRGSIADYIKKQALFPDWKLDENAVSFFEASANPPKAIAAINYNSLAYVAFNPDTDNLFQDKAISFWSKLEKSKLLSVPKLLDRIGIRTKCYVPSDYKREDISLNIFNLFFSEKVNSLIKGKQRDLQIVLDFSEEEYMVKFRLGPMQKNEATRHFNFKNVGFEKSGAYFDIDYFLSGNITHEKVQSLLKKAMKLTWSQIDTIVAAIKI